MFEKTRLKLTGWYLMIIMFVSIFFSLGMYRVLTSEVERFAKVQRIRIEYRTQNDIPFPPLLIADQDLVAEVKKRILLTLVEINLVIFVVSGGLGYFLAGRTLAPIATMVEEQNRFISDASHELRTPLTALKTSMEVDLRDKNLTLEDAKKIISNNIDQIDKLQSLSDNLLELAQYQNSNNHKYFKSISLKKIINEVVEKITPLANKKQISVKKKLVETTIEANKDSINNLLTILLDNAIKYSPEKSQINIFLKKVDKLAVVAVSDQGLGIDKKNLPHIFDRFYRVDQSRTKNQTEGYGLGLAIAKKIVSLHNGFIEVKSQLNKGSTFTVKLPVSA